MTMKIVERKQARFPGRRVFDVYHSGVSEVSVLEITMTAWGISIFDSDGNEIYFGKAIEGYPKGRKLGGRKR